MALQVTGGTVRKFNMKKGNETVEIADPNPTFSPEEVMKFMSNQHPELTNASVTGPTMTPTGEAVYEFKTTVGTKG